MGIDRPAQQRHSRRRIVFLHPDPPQLKKSRRTVRVQLQLARVGFGSVVQLVAPLIFRPQGIVEIRIVRLALNGNRVFLRGLFRLSARRVNLRQSTMHMPGFRIERVEFLKAVPGHLRMGACPQIQNVGILRSQHAGTIQRPRGRLGVSLRQLSDSQPAEYFGTLRLQRRLRFEGVDRRIQLVPLVLRDAQKQMRSRQRRIQRHGTLQRIFRLISVSLAQQRHPQAEKGIGRIGIGADRFPEPEFGFRELAFVKSLRSPLQQLLFCL